MARQAFAPSKKQGVSRWRRTLRGRSSAPCRRLRSPPAAWTWFCLWKSLDLNSWTCAMEQAGTSNGSIEHLLHALAEERAFDLRSYKRSTLERRIRKRMGQIPTHDYSGYLNYIRENPTEINTLLNTVLINVTEFFRDPQA